MELQSRSFVIKQWGIRVGAVAAAVVTIALFVWYFLPHTPAVFVQAQKKVSFPVFYPVKPPDSLQLDEGSFSATKDVVLYTYTYDSGKKRLSVSVQPRGDLDTETFKPTSDFSTTIGRAYLVDLDDRTSAAVVGDKSWVLINAPDKIAVDTLRDFINSLRPVN